MEETSLELDYDASFFAKYKNFNVLFTKEVVELSNLVPKNIIIQSGPYYFPTVIKESSFTEATIIIKADSFIMETVTRYDEGLLSLRFYQQNGEDKESRRYFFVKAQLIESVPYQQDPVFMLMRLEFIEQSEPLVDLLTPFILAIEHSKNRKENRVILDAHTKFLLKIDEEKSHVIVNGHKRRCYLRDISQSGSAFIMKNAADLEVGDAITLVLQVKIFSKPFVLKGYIKRRHPLDNAYAIESLAMIFSHECLTTDFKLFVNDAISIHQQQQVE